MHKPVVNVLIYASLWDIIHTRITQFLNYALIKRYEKRVEPKTYRKRRVITIIPSIAVHTYLSTCVF